MVTFQRSSQQDGPTPRSPKPDSPTQRSQAKETRRKALLTAAAGLFAADGFNRVSLEDLGAAAGVSGPAVYRHFPGKQAVLAELLLSVSRNLLDGGRAVVSEAPDAEAALARTGGVPRGLRPEQSRCHPGPGPGLQQPQHSDQAEVRTLQRNYVELWVGVLGELHPDIGSRRTTGPRPRGLRPHQLDAALGPPPRTTHGGQNRPAHPRAHGTGSPDGALTTQLTRSRCRYKPSKRHLLRVSWA